MMSACGVWGVMAESDDSHGFVINKVVVIAF